MLAPKEQILAAARSDRQGRNLQKGLFLVAGSRIALAFGRPLVGPNASRSCASHIFQDAFGLACALPLTIFRKRVLDLFKVLPGIRIETGAALRSARDTKLVKMRRCFVTRWQEQAVKTYNGIDVHVVDHLIRQRMQG